MQLILTKYFNTHAHLDYERCLSDRLRQNYVTPTTDTDTVLTNRPTIQQDNFIPIHPTVFTYVASTWKCSVRRHTAYFPLFTTTQIHCNMILLPRPLSFTSVLAFSPLLYSIYLAYVQQTASGGTRHVACTHISVCISPFQPLNQLTDFYENRYTSCAPESRSNIALSIYCNLIQYKVPVHT